VRLAPRMEWGLAEVDRTRKTGLFPSTFFFAPWHNTSWKYPSPASEGILTTAVSRRWCLSLGRGGAFLRNFLISRCQARSSSVFTWSARRGIPGVTSSQLSFSLNKALVRIPVFPDHPLFCSQRVRSSGSGVSEKIDTATEVALPR